MHKILSFYKTPRSILKTEDRYLTEIPLELTALIFSKMSPIQAEKARNVSRHWDTAYRLTFREEKRFNKLFNMALCGHLNEQDLTWVALTLIRDRDGPYSDEKISQLCIAAAIFSKNPPTSLPHFTRMIVGIGHALTMGTELFFSVITPISSKLFDKHVLLIQSYFNGLKVPKCFEKAHKSNSFVLFILGMNECMNHSKWKSRKLTKASRKGIASATYVLHLPLVSSQSVIEMNKSYKLLLQSSKQGSSMANFELSQIGFYNIGTRKRNEYLKQAAIDKNPFAMCAVGQNKLDKGQKDKAKQWLSHAKDRGVTSTTAI